MRRIVRTLLVLVLLSLATFAGFRSLEASSGGRTGVAQSATGCACHSTIPNQSGAATVSITGPQQLAPGAIGNYTISVSGGPSGTTGGFNLKATGGTLAAGTNSKVSNGELTHSSNTTRSWPFTWQAPATEGSYSFYAVGQSTNGSGADGDSWNWYGGAVNTPFTIVVSTTGVNPGVAGLWLAPARPNPARGVARLAYALPSASHVRVDILDAAGRAIARLVDAFEPAGTHPVMWMGTADSGARAASGVYLVRLTAGGRTLTTRIHWVR